MTIDGFFLPATFKAYSSEGMTTIFDPATREALISRIQALDPLARPLWVKMTKEQIGIFAYKHIDHHFRQFGV